MNASRTALIAATVLVLPGSCIASQLASQGPGEQKPRPALPKPAASNSPTPVTQVAMGPFQLNRAPVQGSFSIGVVPKGTKRLVVNGQDVAFAPDGRFVVGFGRDHEQRAVIVAYLGDGTNLTDRLYVTKRAWKIENLTTVKRYTAPDAEFQARRPGELDQINAARRTVVNANGWRQQFIWPTHGRISGLFGSQRIYAGEPGSPHSGVDVAAPTGAPVVAPADGVVTLAAASPFTLEGYLLIVDHGMGLDSAFLHLSKIHVKKGDVVRQGQLVGAVGATGRASGPHLHWGMKWKNERIDPQPLAGLMTAPPR